LDDDFDETSDAIVRASGAPLSIIIVGVGRANYDDMVGDSRFMSLPQRELYRN
jgi:hypothetical protein